MSYRLKRSPAVNLSASLFGKTARAEKVPHALKTKRRVCGQASECTQGTMGSGACSPGESFEFESHGRIPDFVKGGSNL